MRKRALLSLSLPLAAAGCLAGHAAGYELAAAGPQDPRIHGYLGLAPQFLATCFALLVFALALRVTGRLQGRPATWPFAFLPPLAFCAQELIERLAVGLPPSSVVEPAVLVGLATQLPLALVAYLAARALLRLADAAGRALAPRPVLPAHEATLRIPAGALALARTPLAHDRLGRAPPR